MKSVQDKLMEQQCPKHGSPYSFIYTTEAETKESRILCDECITRSNATQIISIRKAFKFLEEQYIQENQNRLQITSLWQQFRHNCEQIRGTLRDLEEQLELLLNSIMQDQVTRILKDEFLNKLTTQSGIEPLDHRGYQGQLTLKQQQVEQQKQQCLIKCNEIFEGQNKANAELSCLLDLIQKSIEPTKNINQFRDCNINQVEVTNDTYETTQTIKLTDWCRWISLNSDETQLIAAVGNQINLYQLSKQGKWIEDQYSIEGHTKTIYFVKFNHNSTLIASCSQDSLIIIWNKQLDGKWSILYKISSHENVQSICFNHDSTLLAAGNNKGIIQILNIKNEKQEQQQLLLGHNQDVNDMCFNNDSTKLASGSSDNSIFIWKLNNQGKWIAFQKLKDHTNRVYSVSFNSESNQLLSSSMDFTLRIWQVDEGENWKLIHTLTGHNNTVLCAYFNKQSNMIISSSCDESLKIWKVNKEWKCIQTINQHEFSVRIAIINSDSTMIISGSYDKTIKVHKLK